VSYDLVEQALIKQHINNPHYFFNTAVHGDKSNFDGKNGVLAHAFPPGAYSSLAGDIHFDAAEAWNKDHDLLSVALHEIGHSLGLAHSSIFSSVMYGIYRKKTELHWDDRDGVDALYGEYCMTTTPCRQAAVCQNIVTIFCNL
jgi:hypothetical protein